MSVTTDKPAPYAPTSGIMGLIERYRSRGLPSPVNADVLARAGVSESLIPRTLQALHTLDLIDEVGAPTPTFEALRLAPESEYRKRLEDWLKTAYASVFSFVDPSRDDGARIRDAFRGYQPVGQQERMASLFQGLCAAAGLIPDKTLPSRSSAQRAKSTAPLAARTIQRATKPYPLKPSTGLPPALTGLLESLPNPNDGWTKAEREKFMTTFGAVLDFCYPIVSDTSGTKGNGGQE